MVAVERLQSTDGVSKLAKEIVKHTICEKRSEAQTLLSKEAKLAALEASISNSQEQDVANKAEAAIAAIEISAIAAKMKPFFVVSGSKEEDAILANQVDVIWVRDGHSISKNNALMFAARLGPTGLLSIFYLILSA